MKGRVLEAFNDQLLLSEVVRDWLGHFQFYNLSFKNRINDHTDFKAPRNYSIGQKTH